MQSLVSLTFLILATAISAQQTRELVIDAGNTSGTFKNLQGTNSADSSDITPGPADRDTIYNKEPEIGALFPEYEIKHVLIYTFPDVFLGWGKSGLEGDPSRNENYNWTRADNYMHFVTSNGAKASIQFSPTNATNNNVSSPEILNKIGYMMTDRYMNGAYNSGFYNALELFEFEAETDLTTDTDTEQAYEENFAYFAGFSRGVANASSKAGVSAWGGNRFYPVETNYSVYDPYVSRFYRDCHDQNIPIKAASFHFVNTQFSFDPYDIKRVVDKFRAAVLVPAGLPNLPIWATEYEIASFPALPTSNSALESFNDPAFFASYTIGVSMYAQDTSIEEVMSWPGFGYNGTGAGNQPFQGFFSKSSSGTPIPLNAAKAWLFQAKLIADTPYRVKVEGSSEDGFAVLAGRSANNTKVQVLLNNYQFNYDIAREITSQMIPLMNTSTTAYPLLQDSGLLNGEAACFLTGACLTFPQATVRNNTSKAYHLQFTGLPWSNNDRYKLEVQRVSDNVTNQVYFHTEGQGNAIDITLPFPANAQDLISVENMPSPS